MAFGSSPAAGSSKRTADPRRIGRAPAKPALLLAAGKGTVALTAQVCDAKAFQGCMGPLFPQRRKGLFTAALQQPDSTISQTVAGKPRCTVDVAVHSRWQYEREKEHSLFGHHAAAAALKALLSKVLCLELFSRQCRENHQAPQKSLHFVQRCADHTEG